MAAFSSVCPLDCFDSCGLLVNVQDNRIVNIEGNPQHPITKGTICPKGKRHLNRVYSSDRVLYPLRKKDGAWRRISWDEAYDEIAERLFAIKEEFGTTAVLHNYDYGSNGILKALDQRFFNAYGGVTVPVGSLCWGAGIAAFEYDFGTHRNHEWNDHINAKVILVWGRNISSTNIHMMRVLREAKEKGARIIVINPNRISLGSLPDQYISPRPGTDGALALGIAYTLLENRWIDLDFIQKHVHGFTEFVHLVKDFSPSRVAQITGVGEETIKELGRLYSQKKPGCIILGHGLQRYNNGGNTIRAINALAAITGNIGISGGGVNYGHSYNKEIFQSLAGNELAVNNREFIRAKLGQEILEADKPAIEAIFVTRSNPITQLPNSSKVLEAFQKVKFKVVVDFFLNDTANLADIFLPCTTFLEEEDIIATSWHQYISYVPKLIEPLGETKPDWLIFSELAEKMKLDGFGLKSSEDWLRYALEPAGKFGLTLEKLKEEGFVFNPRGTKIAWEDKDFTTPSGKIELFSKKALDEGLDPLATYREPEESIISQPELAKEYPLHLLTIHHKNMLHSQFFNLIDDEQATSLPVVEINPKTAEERYIRENDVVIIESPRGSITGLARLDDRIRFDVIQMYEGWWHKESPGVNFLTADRVSDMGRNASYYDCLCQVKKYIS